MNVRDLHFTLRAEDALRKLARMPELGLSYLERRHDLEKGSLQAWLDEFNGGEKALTEARLDAVKAEIGAITTGKEARVVEPAPGREGNGRSRKPAYLAICRALLKDPGLSEAAACKGAALQTGSWAFFKKKHFGLGPIAQEKLAKFLGVEVPQAADESAALTAPTAAAAVRVKRHYKRRTRPEPVAGPVRVKRHYKRRAVASTALQPVATTSEAVTVQHESAPNVLSEMLRSQLSGGGNCTHVVGLFRLELDMRLVPVAPGGGR